jgi:hypothetical protein
MTIDKIEEGAYFSCRHSDDYWYRVKITKVIDSEHAAVRYVDYGDTSMASLDNLQPLCIQFRNLPYQAIQARLADVQPISGDWSPEDTFWFNQRVVDKQFVSIVRNVIESSTGELTLDLVLIDTSDPAKDIFIKEELIKEDRATELNSGNSSDLSNNNVDENLDADEDQTEPGDQNDEPDKTLA